MSNLSPISESILRVLLKSRRPLNTNEVAKGAGISWNTAETYLMRLHERGWVNGQRRGTRMYAWTARFNEEDLE